MAADSNSFVIIREVTGQRRSVTLRGGGLPFQGAPWGGTQRVKTTWYPGNAQQASQTVLGPTEKDSSWEGKWRTTTLIRKPCTYSDENGQDFSITSAFTLMEVLEGIFRSGATLSVEWNETKQARNLQRKIVREGMAAEWEFKPDRADDIGWNVQWAWSGRGIQQQKVVAFRTENVNAALRESILAANELLQLTTTNSLISKKTTVYKSADQFSLGQLENLANAPQELVRDILREVQQEVYKMKQIGDLVLKVRAIPSQIAGMILDTATNTVAISNQFIDEISRKPPETLAAKTKLSNLTSALSYYGSGMTQAQYLRRNAQKTRAEAQNQSKSSSTILTVYVVKGATETLAALSLKFYKTTEYGASIAKANGLPLNQLSVERGAVLIIPTVAVVKGFTNNG